MAPRHPRITQFIATSLPQRPGRQRLLAEAIGVSGPTVSRWLKHETSPDPELWPALAEFFNVDLSSIEDMANTRPATPDDALNDLAKLYPEIHDLAVRLLHVETALGGREAVERKALAVLAQMDHAYAASSGDDTPPGTPGSAARPHGPTDGSDDFAGA